MTSPQPQEDNHIMPALALAMVDRPRATLQELAKAVGVSKATLYRFCRTREQLIERLMNHSAEVFTQVIRDSQLDSSPPLEALKKFDRKPLGAPRADRLSDVLLVER